MDKEKVYDNTYEIEFDSPNTRLSEILGISKERRRSSVSVKRLPGNVDGAGFETRGGRISVKELGDRVGRLDDMDMATRVAGIVLLANESDRDPLMTLGKGM
jgi:hypothetical protein